MTHGNTMGRHRGWRSHIRGGLCAVAAVALLATTQGVALAQPPEGDPQAQGPSEAAPPEQEPPIRMEPRGAAKPGPRIISDWEDGDPIPAGYHPRTRARKGMVIGGAVMFGTMYLLTVLVAAAATDVNQYNHYTNNPDGALFVPAVGPFIQMTHANNLATENVLLGIDGVVQSAGVAMFIYGLASPKTVLMRDDLASGDAKPFVRPVPVYLGGGATGVGLVGAF